MKFTELGLQPRLLKALDSLGYHDATPIQQQVIQSFTNGSHIVGQSQTGTGKTAAFVLPIVNTIDPKVKHVQTLVLVPTRELAVQVREEFFNLSKGLIGFRSVAVYGGSRMDRQIEEINKGAQVIVGTPGRVIDMIERGKIKTGSINYFIMDEVDRMLDMGFVDDVEYIRSKIPKLKQVMSFSATITPELRGILHKHIGDNYTSIKIAQEVVVDKVDHSFMDAPHFKKFELLAKYLREHKDQKVVIFTQTKLMTDDLTQTLRKEGFDALALHGDIRQRERMQTIKKLKDNTAQILVATDVASRGLNLKNIALVVNYDVPQDPESYVHRIGRTARAGQTGKAIMFVDKGEYKYLEGIERRNKIRIKKIDEHGKEIERPLSQGRGGDGGRPARSRGRSRGGYSSGGRSSGGYSGSSSRGSSGGGYFASKNSDSGERRSSYSSRGGFSVNKSSDSRKDGEKKHFSSVEGSRPYEGSSRRFGSSDRSSSRGGSSRSYGSNARPSSDRSSGGYSKRSEGHSSSRSSSRPSSSAGRSGVGRRR